MGERGDWFEKLKFSRIVSLEISAALPRETIASTRGRILSGEKFSKFCFSIGDCIRITRKQDTYGRSDRGRERKRKETLAQADKDNKEDDKHDDDK